MWKELCDEEPLPFRELPFPYMFVLSMGCNILGIIFAGLTKIMLKHSKIFGALLISSALLNLFILTGFYIGFPSVGLFAHMLLIILVWLWPLTLPFTLSFLVGVSLIIPSKTQAFTRKELIKETIDFGIVGSIFGFYGTLSFFVGVISIFEAPPFGLIGLAIGAPLLWVSFRATRGFYKYVKRFRIEQKRDKLGTNATDLEETLTLT